MQSDKKQIIRRVLANFKEIEIKRYYRLNMISILGKINNYYWSFNFQEDILYVWAFEPGTDNAVNVYSGDYKAFNYIDVTELFESTITGIANIMVYKRILKDMKNIGLLLLLFLFACSTVKEAETSTALEQCMKSHRETVAENNYFIEPAITALQKEVDYFEDIKTDTSIFIVYGILCAGNYDFRIWHCIGKYEEGLEVNRQAIKRLVALSEAEKDALFIEYLDKASEVYGWLTSDYKQIIKNSLAYCKNYLQNYDEVAIKAWYDSLEDKNDFTSYEPFSTDKKYTAYRKLGAQIDRILIWHKAATKEQLFKYIDWCEQRIAVLENE